MRTSYYSNDPKWITAKFESTCAWIVKYGISTLYLAFTASAKSVSCAKDECGKQESRDFDAAKFDECVYSGNF